LVNPTGGVQRKNINNQTSIAFFIKLTNGTHHSASKETKNKNFETLNFLKV
jgi:hypothetical protein